MYAKVQICARISESEISALHGDLSMLGTIRLLKATVLTPQNYGMFQWCSDFKECLTQFPEDEIEKLIDKKILETLKVMRSSLEDVMIVLVCEHESTHEDKPRGYSISPSLISMLSDIGASLEIDIVSNLRKPVQCYVPWVPNENFTFSATLSGAGLLMWSNPVGEGSDVVPPGVCNSDDNDCVYMSSPDRSKHVT